MLNKIRDHPIHAARIIRDWLSKQLMSKKQVLILVNVLSKIATIAE